MNNGVKYSSMLVDDSSIIIFNSANLVLLVLYETLEYIILKTPLHMHPYLQIRAALESGLGSRWNFLGYGIRGYNC
jgi:hypothetical protein